MQQDIFDDKSTLVQVMAWCRQQRAITWLNVDPVLYRHMASLGHNRQQDTMYYQWLNAKEM